MTNTDLPEGEESWRPTTWWPARQRFAAMAVLAATLTGAALAALGGSAPHVYGAGAYLGITLVALFSPAAIVVQVIAGLALAGNVLVADDAPAALLLLPVVAGVVATAELLAVAARLDAPVERRPGGELRRTGLAAVIGAGVFGAVVLVGGLPGPTGLLAVALSAGACAALAVVLVRIAQRGERAPGGRR